MTTGTETQVAARRCPRPVAATGSRWFPPGAGAVTEAGPVPTAGAADAGAAEELFRSVYPKLAGWARRLIDDEETAHEIASEAFVRLLSRWATVDSPKSYLYTVAANLVRDHWRRAERERRVIRSAAAGRPTNR